MLSSGRAYFSISWTLCLWVFVIYSKIIMNLSFTAPRRHFEKLVKSGLSCNSYNMMVDKSKLLFSILFLFKYKGTVFLKLSTDWLDTESKIFVYVATSFTCACVYLSFYEGEHDFFSMLFYIPKYKQNRFSCSEHGEVISPASFGLWQHTGSHQQLYVDRQWTVVAAS